MRLQKRNLVTIHYCLYLRKEVILDEDGNETSEYKCIYDSPVNLDCNVSASMGEAQTEMFGNLDSYDKIVVVDDINCPIDGNTVLFVDTEPTFDDEDQPLYDYIVKRVGKSLNSISYSISKVETS